MILFEYCTHKCRFAKSSSLCNSLRIFFSYLIGFFERMKAPMPEHVCVCQHFNYDSPLMFVFPSLHKCIMTLPSHLHMFSLLLCHYDNILLSYLMFFHSHSSFSLQPLHLKLIFLVHRGVIQILQFVQAIKFDQCEFVIVSFVFLV